MTNRCDSVDALMYAYYAFMKNKEENQMLEKNKDYIEFRLTGSSVHGHAGEVYDIKLDGLTNNPYFPAYPGARILEEGDEDVVLVSKKKFEKMQADNEYYRERAKQWEENHNLLLEKTGFTSVGDLIDYICDPSMISPEDKTLKEIIDECETDYISERDKAEALKIENEQLKSKLHEYDPIPDYKELLAKLYSKDDVEKLEWTLNHICGGQASVNGWIATSSFWKQNCEALSKLVGFSSVEEIQDYLTNEAECDTLREAISKLKDQVKYTCDEWYSANSSNNSWKAAAECNSPKELIEKIKGFREEIEMYYRLFKEWKTSTGCPSPSAAKTLIESGASWHHAYNEIKEKNRKLEEEINELRADYSHLLCTTGFESEGEIEDALDKCDHSTLRKALVDHEFDYDNLLKLTGYKNEDAIHVLLHGDPHEHRSLRDLINSLKRHSKFTESNWQHATGCDIPGEARILLEKWKVLTKCETPEAAATWITSYESACERGNRLAQDIENWKNVTGYSTPEEYKGGWDKIRRLCEGIYKSNDNGEREKEWQKATGCDTPEMAEGRIKYYHSRLGNAVQAASCAAKHLDNITF